MIIIPAIDLIDGRAVRLVKGDFSTATTYNENPLAFAQQLEDAGLSHLHLVDLDGARLGVPQHMQLAAAIAAGTHLQVDYSGGVRDGATISTVLQSGAAYITLGSLAAAAPELVLAAAGRHGHERFIIALDTFYGQLRTHGWLRAAEQSLEALLDYYLEAGFRRFMITEVARDGTLHGPDTELYRSICAGRSSLQLIASGGVGTLNHLSALRDAGCAAAIVGRAMYEQRISLQELAHFQAQSTC